MLKDIDGGGIIRKNTKNFDKQILNNKKLFKEEKSSASCKVSDIVGFIYGGQSSRFWMLRKYLISMPAGTEKKFVNLKSWNCITIQLKNRDVDLVIQDDHDMKMLIKFLVMSLRTIDGRRDTGQKILIKLFQQEERSYA